MKTNYFVLSVTCLLFFQNPIQAQLLSAKDAGSTDSLKYYTKIYEASKALFDTDTTDISKKENLAKSLEKVGDAYVDLRKPDSALIFYERYSRIEKELLATFPKNVDYKFRLATAYQELGTTYAQYPQPEKAMSLMGQSNKLMHELYVAFPNNPDYQLGAMLIEPMLNELASMPENSEMEISGKDNEALGKYRLAVENCKTNAEKVEPQTKLVNIYDSFIAKNKSNKLDSMFCSSANGTLSYFLLFKKQFAQAEKVAKRGLMLNASENWIKTNLAHALLYQNKFTEAQKVYTELKTQNDVMQSPLAKACLDDLDALEKEGITHPDVAKIRALLKQ